MPKSNLCKTKEVLREDTLKGLIAGGMATNNISNDELAKMIGVSLKTISNYRSAPATIPFRKLMQICDALGIKLQMSIKGVE